MRFGGLILPLAIVLPSVALGAGRVELEVYIEARVPATAGQEWLRALGQAGVQNLRIRSERPGDVTGIERRGPDSSPTYFVTGALVSTGEIVVPGARFRPTESRRLAAWLDDLGAHGPLSEREAKGAFGLGSSALDRARRDLAQPVGFSTQGIARADFIRRVAPTLASPLRADASLREPAQSDTIAEELSGVSCGTALACVVRPLGFALVVGETGSGGIEYRIVPARKDMELWPVGWESEKRPAEVLPSMHEFLDINVQNVPITTVLKAVGERLNVPVLVDHNALARHGIDPEKTIVNLPQRRTTYSLLLDKTLFQARLKSEVRLDEAGKPLLWVTTLKPI